MHRPVDDAEHQLQMIREPLMHLRDDASAAQRAGRREPLGPSCASSAGRYLPRATRTPLVHRVRLFARERENVAQEGFNALVHRVGFPGRTARQLSG
jgi:hypothetical protein